MQLSPTSPAAATSHSSRPQGLSLGRSLVLFVMLVLPVLVVAITMEDGHWVDGLPSLRTLAVAGLALGFFMGQGRLGIRKGVVVGLVSGIGIGSGLGFLAVDAQVTLSGIAVVLLGVAWLTGYTTGWLAHRGGFGLLAAIPGAAVMLILLGLLPDHHYGRLLLYALAATPAVACLHTWRQPSPGRLSGWLTISAAGLALVAVVLPAARSIPSPARPLPFVIWPGFQDPFYSFWETMSRPLSAAPDRTASVVLMPEALPFTNPINLSEDVLLTIRSPSVSRLRTQVYEIYTGEGWTSLPDAPEVRSEDAPLREWVARFDARREVTTSVRLHSRTNQIAFAGLPVEASMPAIVTLSARPPPSIHAPAALPKSNPRPGGVAAQVSGGDEDFLVAGPPIYLKGTAMLRPLFQYTTVGSVSEATDAQLKAAGTQYPTWVTDRYLQLPAGFPASVRQMATELTEGAATPHEKAVALESFLRSLPYSTDVVAPPPGRDGVEYFLVEQRVGFCQYFASSMITMLRSLGVPARLVVGFAPGTPNDSRAVRELRASDYHSWPEVYFPRYGWVEFEPTPVAVQPHLESLGIEESDDCAQGPEFCAAIQDAGITEAMFGGDIDAGGSVEPVGTSGSRLSTWHLALIALGEAAALIAVVSWYVGRITGRLGVAASTYGSMCLLGLLLGVQRRPNDTPYEYGDRLAALLPAHTREIAGITRLFTVARYASFYEPSVDEVRAARLGWRLLRRTMLRAMLLRLFGIQPQVKGEATVH